ncbi:MAG: hypothetical protein ACK40G_14995 [Cytophagaceae bacterium]
MELVNDLIKILLPAAVVLYAMYLTVKAFLNKDFEKKLIEIKQKNTEIVLPVRLQAYERMCLFLERISPNNLLVRVNEPGFTSARFRQQLLHEIREEYNHNLSQQVYMSDQAWQLVKSSMDDVTSIINQAGESVNPESRSVELARVIFDKMMERNEDPVEKSLKFLKNEIRQVF